MMAMYLLYGSKGVNDGGTIENPCSTHTHTHTHTRARARAQGEGGRDDIVFFRLFVCLFIFLLMGPVLQLWGWWW